MGLSHLVQVEAPTTIEEQKAHIEAEVATALTEGYGVVEVEIPFSMHAELREWVESEGMRCGCTVAPGKVAVLVINTTLAPLPPKSPEQIKAEIDAILERDRATLQAFGLEARIAALEDELASIKGGA